MFHVWVEVQVLSIASPDLVELLLREAPRQQKLSACVAVSVPEELRSARRSLVVDVPGRLSPAESHVWPPQRDDDDDHGSVSAAAAAMAVAKKRDGRNAARWGPRRMAAGKAAQRREGG
eukprot:CAMPEP_0203936642 /NCGR_PEP_ID=MMETSP0359-20131031/74113_1 /ASSEMBLY_ACC=CAM_ASM_000338 /TAXON_ID=268821 /ORGANISM="Scrippsiella Hangoei, Strain SHTV-5" /LENGTH=118 /DNA_ID=CAMNT_0050866637 /DNA_START=353 /DNA_END=706 /DNA_ORIENTATION=+